MAIAVEMPMMMSMMSMMMLPQLQWKREPLMLVASMKTRSFDLEVDVAHVE